MMGRYAFMNGHLFEMVAVVGWAIVGLGYLIEPELLLLSPVGSEAQPFSTMWCVLYVVGALLTVWGLVRRRGDTRAAGLIIVATGLLMNGVAAAAFALDLRTALYFIYALACLFRAASVARGVRAVAV